MGFTINKFIHQVFDINNNIYPKPSLFNSSKDDQLFILIYYNNNFFSRFKDFESPFQVLSNQFFLYIKWACVQLFSKKLKFFQSKLRVLEIIYYISDIVKIDDDKIKIVVQFSKQLLLKDIKSFLKIVNMRRQ